MSGAEIRAHSAIHVLKGAVTRVLGGRRTVSVDVSDGKGTLGVEFDREPGADETRRLEEESNRKIQEDSEILQFEMDKEEAEAHFGEGIYGIFPVPGGGTRLKIVRIPEWEIDCCSAQHVETCAEIGRIRVDGLRFSSAERLLEIEFHLE